MTNADRVRSLANSVEGAERYSFSLDANVQWSKLLHVVAEQTDGSMMSVTKHTFRKEQS